MADPVVHITSGVPDSGTGNITTLGMTVASQGQSLTGQLGPLMQGSVTTSAPAYSNGQISPLSMTPAGSLRVDGSAVTQPVSGSVSITGTAIVSGTVTANQGGAWTVAATQSGTWNINNISGAVSLPTGASTSANQPTAAAIGSTTSGQTGNLAMGAVTTAAPSYTTATTNNLSLTTAGALRVDGSAATQPVSIAAAVTVAQATAANLNATVTGTITANQGGAPWSMNGDTASGVTDANNPIKVGGVCHIANPTPVADGQRVNATFDKMGKQVVVGAIRVQKGVQKTSITTASETTVVTAGGAGVFNDVYAIVVTNKSATAVFVDFKDATAGTTRMTLAAPASDTRGFTVTVDSAMVQSAAANNWTATVSAAVTSIEITMLYVSNL